MCGEGEKEKAKAAAAEEIPPRVRGRDPKIIKAAPSTGNTPACAGKGDGDFLAGLSGGKYPRVCGEGSMPAKASSRMVEIPPRVRGRESSNPHPTFEYGNTPACAGKGGQAIAYLFFTWKYPRVCGEGRTALKVST